MYCAKLNTVPERLSEERKEESTTEQTYTSDLDDDLQSYSAYRKVPFVQSERQCINIRKRIVKDVLKGKNNSSANASSKHGIPAQSQEYDAMFKIVLIGAQNTGKTSLLLRFIRNQFADSYLCTIGVDFKIKTIQVDHQLVKLQIWDTAGQERFRAISQAYYRNSHGCIAVYDINDITSFQALSDQIQNFINYSPSDSARNIVLVGNKLDLSDSKRQVSFAQALKFAKQMGLAGVIETSAKQGLQSLDDAFFIASVNAKDFKDQSDGSSHQVRRQNDQPHLNSMQKQRSHSRTSSFESLQQLTRQHTGQEQVAGRRSARLPSRPAQNKTQHTRIKLEAKGQRPGYQVQQRKIYKEDKCC